MRSLHILRESLDFMNTPLRIRWRNAIVNLNQCKLLRYSYDFRMRISASRSQGFTLQMGKRKRSLVRVSLWFLSPTPHSPTTLVNVASVEMLPKPIPIPNWKLATLELDIFTLATFTNSNSNTQIQSRQRMPPRARSVSGFPFLLLLLDLQMLPAETFVADGFALAPVAGLCRRLASPVVCGPRNVRTCDGVRGRRAANGVGCRPSARICQHRGAQDASEN